MGHARTHLLTALACVVVACGVPAGTNEARTTTTQIVNPAPTSTTVAKEPATTAGPEPTLKAGSFDCPVTIPAQPGFKAASSDTVEYSENFPEPDQFPHEYPHDDMVWYGTDDLWTALDTEGDHGGRKSVWWSVNFPGGIVEGEPDVFVTWTRLDSEEPIVMDNGGKATNAFTPEEGWFMIAGIDPTEPGCWKVEATYKGATLSYIYEWD